MPFEELFQAAAIGLLKGSRKYDPTLINEGTGKPYRVSTFLVPFINGAMLHWLRDKGHMSGVKFPDSWRDHAPTVRRMANQGKTIQEVVEATGLRQQDIEEILQAQGATRLYDPDVHANASYDPDIYNPDPLDEVETYEELAENMRIADEAYAALSWANQRMLVTGWEMPRKRQLAYLPHQEFMRLVHRILRKEPVTIMKQTGLELEVDSVQVEKQKANKKQKDLEVLQKAEEQLALFAVLNTDEQIGKTASVDVGVSSAAADQPSDDPG